MKGRISRSSHRRELRYSAVYQRQGAMITDADLNERSDIEVAQLIALGADAIRDGVPAEGGAVTFEVAPGGLLPLLRPGIIYADGARGELTAATAPPPAGASPLWITAQPDLPQAPAVPGGAQLVYVDVWDRPVFLAEDAYLADAGLHGAETGFRSQRMTQLKIAPEAEAADIEAGENNHPRIGDAVATLTERDPAAVTDPCDPCSALEEDEIGTPDTLWRFEILHVEGPPTAPTAIMLAWSDENGAELVAADGAKNSAFEVANRAYEYCSPVTERHRGVMSGAWGQPKRSQVEGGLLAPVPDRTDVPLGGLSAAERKWPWARRWLGAARIDIAGNAINAMGTGLAARAGSAATVTLDQFELEIDWTGRRVVAGDFWLVEARAHGPVRFRLRDAAPLGIRHHYAVLFRLNNGQRQPLTDLERRRLSFPQLSNLPADHVAYENHCVKLFGDAENVQEALDNLCAIQAEDIGFENHCGAGSRFDGATDVQEAFDRLCEIKASEVTFEPEVECRDFYGGAKITVKDALDVLCDREPSLDVLYRYFFDWGVICGVHVTQVRRNAAARVLIARGTALDLSPRFFEVKGGDVDLNDRNAVTIHPDYLQNGRFNDVFRRDVVSDGVCLALLWVGGDVQVHIVPRGIGLQNVMLSYSERQIACRQGVRPVFTTDKMTALAAKEAASINFTLTRMQTPGLEGHFSLDVERTGHVEGFAHSIVDDYEKTATKEKADAIRAEMARLKEERAAQPPDNLIGRNPIEDVKRAEYAASLLDLVGRLTQEDLQACLCAALIPPCPPPAKEPFYVPIACLKGSVDGDTLFLTEVCLHCCRKQAITPRALAYWRYQDLFKDMSHRICCPEGARPGGPGGVRPPKYDLYFPPEWEIMQPYVPSRGPTYMGPTLGEPGAPAVDLDALNAAVAAMPSPEAAYEYLGVAGFKAEVVDLDRVGDPAAEFGRVAEEASKTGLVALAQLPRDSKVALFVRDGRPLAVAYAGKAEDLSLKASERVVRESVETARTELNETLAALSDARAEFVELTRKQADLTRKVEELADKVGVPVRPGPELPMAERPVAELPGLDPKLVDPLVKAGFERIGDFGKVGAEDAFARIVKASGMDRALAMRIVEMARFALGLDKLRPRPVEPVPPPVEAPPTPVEPAPVEPVPPEVPIEKQPVTAIPGVDEEIAKGLKRIGLVTVGDFKEREPDATIKAIAEATGLTPARAKTLFAAAQKLLRANG